MEIIFLGAWLLIAEAWWSGVRGYWSRQEQSRANTWAVVLACAAYLLVLGPLAVWTGLLEARVQRRASGESIREALRSLAHRALSALILVLVLAQARHYWGLWGLVLAVVAIWVLRQWVVKRGLRATVSAAVPSDNSQERIQTLQASAARMGLTDTPVTITPKVPPGVLASCPPSHGRGHVIIFSATALALLDDPEIEAVLAHEVAHCRLGHTRSWFRLWMGTFLVEVALLGLLILQPWGRTPPPAGWTVPQLPRLLLALCLIHLFVQPVWAAISRRHERAANRLALELTGDPRAAISAYGKIGRHFGVTGSPSWWQRLMSNHPSLDEMISHARQFARERGIPLEEAPQQETTGP